MMMKSSQISTGSQSIDSEAVAYADDATDFSTFMRKKSKPEALDAAKQSFIRLLSLLKISGIDLYAVMKAEQA